MRTLTYVSLCLVLLSGCAGANSYLFRDKPDLVSPARRLAEAYLDGQKNGETYKEASKKYGKGATEFLGLKEYRYLEAGYFFYTPVLRYRMQATNQMGGVVWRTYDIGFSYDEKLASQEPYRGLGIKEVYETMF
ncbi:MAG: hypothetical protein Q8O22_07720 [Candidatus Omnitrophota bacterium]|nr:hypothetical protein [Candidatus Omnitrophota bacterium]